MLLQSTILRTPNENIFPPKFDIISARHSFPAKPLPDRSATAYERTRELPTSRVARNNIHVGIQYQKSNTFKCNNQKNQLHAVSRIQQGRQRELSVKTLHSPLSAEFGRHCVLSGRTQRRALPQEHSEELEI